MANDTLFTQISNIIDSFLLNNSLLFIGLVFLIISIKQFYYSYLSINRDTNDVDMGKQYVKLEMKRRYRL